MAVTQAGWRKTNWSISSLTYWKNELAGPGGERCWLPSALATDGLAPQGVLSVEGFFVSPSLLLAAPFFLYPTQKVVSDGKIFGP